MWAMSFLEQVWDSYSKRPLSMNGTYERCRIKALFQRMDKEINSEGHHTAQHCTEYRTIAEKIAESQYIQRKLYVLKQNRKQDKRTKKDATMQTL